MKMFIMLYTSLFVSNISDQSLNKNHQFNWDEKKVIDRNKKRDPFQETEVVPVSKKIVTLHKNNYRPISLLSHLSKIIEEITLTKFQISWRRGFLIC